MDKGARVGWAMYGRVSEKHSRSIQPRMCVVLCLHADDCMWSLLYI